MHFSTHAGQGPDETRKLGRRPDSREHCRLHRADLKTEKGLAPFREVSVPRSRESTSGLRPRKKTHIRIGEEAVAWIGNAHVEEAIEPSPRPRRMPPITVGDAACESLPVQRFHVEVATDDHRLAERGGSKPCNKGGCSPIQAGASGEEGCAVDGCETGTTPSVSSDPLIACRNSSTGCTHSLWILHEAGAHCRQGFRC